MFIHFGYSGTVKILRFYPYNILATCNRFVRMKIFMVIFNALQLVVIRRNENLHSYRPLFSSIYLVISGYLDESTKTTEVVLLK